MAEKDIEKRIVKALREKGAYVLKIHGSPMQPKAIDLIACYRGKLMGIEVKQPKQKPTERKKYTLSQITEAGGYAIVATGTKRVIRWLDFFDTGKINAGPEVGIPILEKRRKRAVERLGKLISHLDSEFILSVAAEIGLLECIAYTENMQSLEFDLTPLQVVSLSNALAACYEIRYESVEGRARI